MTDRIAEITERLGKATPGEWDYYGGSHTFGVRAGARYIVGCDINCYVNGNVFPRNAGVFLMVDAQFIAHAKGDIEYLLSALSAMSARVEEARREGLEQARKAVEAMPLYEEIKPGYQSARKHGLHDAVRVIHALSARDKDHG